MIKTIVLSVLVCFTILSGCANVKEESNDLYSIDKIEKNIDLSNIYRERYDKYTDEELNDLYIMEMEQYDIIAEIGNKSIYFLDQSAFYDTEQTYTTLTGPEAEYIEISDNYFMEVRSLGDNLREPYTLSTKNILEYDENDVDRTYTLEEIISEIKQ